MAKTHIKHLITLGIAVFLVLQLTGCSAAKKPAPKVALKKRYKLAHDEAPKSHEPPPDLHKIPDATPIQVCKSRMGNPKSYTVFKKSYCVLQTSKGFKERGKASWYGKKFHGYKTSNGETYDMYSMSAAHKTLPLPTFVRVKNLDNGKSIIVKVNDRGPFHDERIIDLSYAAAHKLGILAKGTAHVEVEAIDPELPQPRHYLQVAAFKTEANAKKLALQLKNVNLEHPVEVRAQQSSKNKLYLVQIGPIKNDKALPQIHKKLSAKKFPKPISVHVE